MTDREHFRRRVLADLDAKLKAIDEEKYADAVREGVSKSGLQFLRKIFNMRLPDGD